MVGSPLSLCHPALGLAKVVLLGETKAEVVDLEIRGDKVDITLWGVLLGGLLGIAGALLGHLIARAESRAARHRQELLPPAARVLTFAEEAWVNLERFTIFSEGKKQSSEGISAVDYLLRYGEAHHAMNLAMNELTLFLPEVPARDDLLDSLKLGSLIPGEDHTSHRERYLEARTSFVAGMRKVLP